MSPQTSIHLPALPTTFLPAGAAFLFVFRLRVRGGNDLLGEPLTKGCLCPMERQIGGPTLSLIDKLVCTPPGREQDYRDDRDEKQRFAARAPLRDAHLVVGKEQREG